VTDADNPQRSAIVLAAGGSGDDGLLQMSEILEIDWGGRLVVLSGCRTATGDLLQGAGVASLARAFLQAGAHAVVGSLWPLRDDETAAVFDRFYEHLARGASVSAALSTAHEKARAEGLPPAAWSGLVLIGDGSLVPLPGGVARGFRITRTNLGIALLVLAGVLVLVRVMSRAR